MSLLTKKQLHISLLVISILALVCAELWLRPTTVDLNLFRIPRLLTALIAGAILSISGLFIQGIFRNPLAGPYIIGVIPGAHFAVALFIFLIPSQLNNSIWSEFGLKSFAILGGISVMLLQLRLMKKYSSVTILLLFGVIFSYFLSGGSETLVSISNASEIKSYVQWGFGSFDQVFGRDLWVLLIVLLINLFSIIKYTGSLDVYSIGDNLANNTGLSVLSFRMQVLFIAGASAGIVTAYCGPIGFVGMVAPQFARLLSKSQSAKNLWPYTILSGMLFCLLADVVSHYAFENLQLSLNAMTAIFCAPIVAVSLFRNRKLF